MSYFDNYLERLACRGVGSKENQESRLIKSIANSWDFNSPSSREVDVTRTNGEIENVRIQTTKKTVGIDRVYVHPEDRLYSGDIIHTLQDFSWLVLDVSFRAHIFQTATIVRLNRILKWQYEGIIYEQPVEIKPFSRVEGTKDYYFFSVPDDTLNILFPNNEKLSKLKRDQRFIIDDLPYRVTKFSRTKYVGVTVVYIVEDLGNPSDENGIADYVPPLTEPTDQTYIQGENEIIYGYSKTYSLWDGSSRIIANWSIKNTPKWVKLVEKNDQVAVIVQDSLEHIDKIFILQAEYDGELYSKPIVVRSLM